MFGFVCALWNTRQANYHIDHRKYLACLCWESIYNEFFAYSKISVTLFAVDLLHLSASLPFSTSTLLSYGNHCSSLCVYEFYSCSPHVHGVM